MPEKGCIEVAKKLVGTKFKVVIAGMPQDKEIEIALLNICGKANNIELKFGYISDSEYKSLLSQSKYALMNYQGEYSRRSSGAVYSSIYAGVPVVGCRCKALQFIEDNGLGYIYDRLEEFEPDVLMNEIKHDGYLTNIANYCSCCEEFKVKLKIFFGD